MTSQNIALWALINTQSKGGYSNRKKGRYPKLITITFDWIGIFWWGFQQNNSLKAFYQHPENQEYFKFLYICPLNGTFQEFFCHFYMDVTFCEFLFVFQNTRPNWREAYCKKEAFLPGRATFRSTVYNRTKVYKQQNFLKVAVHVQT